MGYDNRFYCIGSEAANSIWYFDGHTQTWTQITALGNGWMGIAAVSASDIYILKPTSGCASPNYGIFHWNGTAVTQMSGCAQTIAAGEDDTILVTNSYSGFLSQYILLPGASSWTQLDTSTGWTQMSLLDMTTVCGVKNGVINMYSTGTGAFIPMSPLPPAAVSVYTCNISNDPSDGLTLFSMYKTTNNHGQYISALAKYNFTSNTWTTVMTPSAPSAIASISKWQTMMLDASGHPYHFNVNGVMYTVTTSGTGPNCPGLNGCPPNTHHAQTLCVSLPGGMNGGCGTQSVIPTTNLYNQRYDVTATGCDALFGDMGACIPVESGDVLCSATNSDLGGPSDSSDPIMLDSEYVGQWDENFTSQPELAKTGKFLGYTWWEVPTRVGVTSDACRPGTFAACAPPYGQATVGKLGVCWGSDCTAAKAISAGKANAIAHSPGNFLGYGIYYTYFEGDPNTCTLTTYWDDARAGVDPCH